MILVRALHAGSAAAPEVRSHTAQLGDRYLLCSDGLHIPLPPGEIRRVLANHAQPQADVLNRMILRLTGERGTQVASS